MSDQTALRRRSAPPEPGAMRPFHLPPLEGDDLASGLRVRSMVRSDVPLVSVCLVLDAGEVTAPPERAGLAVLAGDSLTGGTARRSGAELDGALEGLGITLRVSTGWDATTLTFTCVAERLDEAMELLSEVTREPTFPETEVDRVRRQRLAAIRQRQMDPARLADDEIDRVLFPADHPYHRPLSGEVESVGAVTRDDALAFVQNRYRPGGAGLVVVGDLTADDVLGRARRHFSRWNGGKAPVVDVPPTPLPELREVILVQRPDSVQSEIRIGLPGPRRGVHDEAALEVGNSILGGAFTSRLNLNLREEHGFTYGVRSGFAMRRHGGTFMISTSVQAEVTAAALAEAVGELERFVSDGPTVDEVDQARDYLAGVFPLRMETGAQLAARVAELLIFDLSPDYHHGYREKIRAVEAEHVQESMTRYLDPARAPIVVVGDADEVREPLEALGLGPVTVREP